MKAIIVYPDGLRVDACTSNGCGVRCDGEGYLGCPDRCKDSGAVMEWENDDEE